MSNWPEQLSLLSEVSTITTFHQHSIGGAGTSGGPSSITWAATNLALYIPFRISSTLTITQLMVMNGAAVSGNVDVGIYDSAGTKLVSSGSTAQAGTSAIQAFNVTDTQIAPGQFYFAIAFDNTTATTMSSGSLVANMCKFVGMAQQASAFALPATATFATCANTGMPLMGLATQGTV